MIRTGPKNIGRNSILRALISSLKVEFIISFILGNKFLPMNYFSILCIKIRKKEKITIEERLHVKMEEGLSKTPVPLIQLYTNNCLTLIHLK